jgi:RNA polymerase sigma-70 factor, ECF subfamily
MEFSEIYKEYSPKIFRFCLGYVNDYDKAKDLTQDTFIAVLEGLVNFRGEAGIGTWIFKIAANKCLRQLDNEKRHQKLVTTLPVNTVTTIREKEEEEKHNFLRNCIAQLPETDRLIIGLHLEDVPQEKIADIIGISHANVRVKVHRIKIALTEQFKNHGKI